MPISREVSEALRKAISTPPDCGDLAAILSQAILRDLEKLEAIHRQRQLQVPPTSSLKFSEAELREKQAGEVRVCLVTAQAAINRALGL